MYACVCVYVCMCVCACVRARGQLLSVDSPLHRRRLHSQLTSTETTTLDSGDAVAASPSSIFSSSVLAGAAGSSKTKSSPRTSCVSSFAVRTHPSHSSVNLFRSLKSMSACSSPSSRLSCIRSMTRSEQHLVSVEENFRSSSESVWTRLAISSDVDSKRICPPPKEESTSLFSASLLISSSSLSSMSGARRSKTVTIQRIMAL